MTLGEAIAKGKKFKMDALCVHHMGEAFWIEEMLFHFDKGYIELVLKENQNDISMAAMRRTVGCTCTSGIFLCRSENEHEPGKGDKLMNDMPLIATLDGALMPIEDLYRDEESQSTYLLTNSYDAFIHKDLIKQSPEAVKQTINMLGEFANIMQTIKEIESENENYTRKINLGIKLLQQVRNLQLKNEVFKGLIDKLKKEKDPK
ncbi:ND2 superfamily protein [Azobacteroides phage ProJPt-Bp1]|uniref:ND2 superfamily protein n=1 Tax=Azobacteroides phage ProJPt-Bp1 TaxID=1920526 RepID=A0A1V1FUZ2_9CAUD|nr:ND2 superfamily protein [Azobacteroides phage ProJPt-Bp1]BAX03416.1 ND2 superfamily protein [Azobacteroides phage ProJPt-Bp1]